MRGERPRRPEGDTDATPDSPTPEGLPDFRARVLAWVCAIPEGRVATYGQIAALAGAPRAARQVGAVLRGLADPDDVPWQRVVSVHGEISTYKLGYGELQRALLEREGVEVNDLRRIDLGRYRWRPEMSGET